MRHEHEGSCIDISTVWRNFSNMESWFALACSPDKSIFARTWSDGNGNGGTTLLDLRSHEQCFWETQSKVIVALACDSLVISAALILANSYSNDLQLFVRRGNNEYTTELSGDRWSLTALGDGVFIAVPQHTNHKQIVISSNEGIRYLDLGGTVITSVAGSYNGSLYANAINQDNSVRLAAINLSNGSLEWFDNHVLGVKVDGKYLVTTTTVSPDFAQLTNLDTLARREINLQTFDGDLTVCAVSPEGKEILLGVHRGFDDLCIALNLSDETTVVLSDKESSFGVTGFYFEGKTYWVQSAVDRSPVLKATNTNDDFWVTESSEVITSPSIEWESTSEVWSVKSEDQSVNIDMLVITPSGIPRPKNVVICLHGGPRSRWSRKYEQLQQLFVASGAIVIAPNMRGSSSDDRNFERSLRGGWGNVDRKDLELVIGEVRRRYPNTRVVAFGQSYGAYQAFQTILSEPTILDAAILAAGFASPEGLIEEGGPPSIQSSLISQEAVPSQWAGGKGTLDLRGIPVWVLHGENDPIIPIKFGEKVHKILLSQGAKSVFTAVPQAAHQPIDGDKELHGRMMNFVINPPEYREDVS